MRTTLVLTLNPNPNPNPYPNQVRTTQSIPMVTEGAEGGLMRRTCAPQIPEGGVSLRQVMLLSCYLVTICSIVRTAPQRINPPRRATAPIAPAITGRPA